MIAFKYRSAIKRIKIKTNQKLDERMSHWLQGVFSIKNPIIGFKTADNKYYDVDCFYTQKEKFYDEQVQIIDASDQIEISFTSDNLNSSSFIRPSQPNTSQINQKVPSQECQDFFLVSQLKGFERSKLQEGKDLSILFDVNPIYKKYILENGSEFISNGNYKIRLFIFVNNRAPKYSSYKIYIGKILIINTILHAEYKTQIKNIIKRYTRSKILQQKIQTQIKVSYQQQQQQQIQDQAPSFTTYHLQQRLNQDTCLDYLMKMHREKHLKPYQYTKLVQRCQENYTDFYRIFCQGIIDTDYQSFKNQLLLRVDNNLEILLSNVDEMDLSRPISRQEQRKNLKKSVASIEIVKVQNYSEIMDSLNDILDHQVLNQLKQYLLEENSQLFNNFALYLSRDIDRNQLANRLKQFLANQNSSERPRSRCVPRSTNKIKSSQPTQQQAQQPPPMFGPSKQSHSSPIKYMSDIDSNYKQAWAKLENKVDLFSSQQYGLLYHYLETRDDSISNFIQEMEWDEQKSIQNLKTWLKGKIKQLLSQHFSQNQIQYFEEMRNSQEIECIYQNFKYEGDIQILVQSLKEEIKNKPILTKKLNKKKSDSQLMDNKGPKSYGKRKYSDQKAGSPKQSQISLYQRTQQQATQQLAALDSAWREELEEMLNYCNFTQQKKQEYIREAFKDGNPSVFIWIRNYIQQKNQIISVEQLKRTLKIREEDNKFIFKVVPIFSEMLKCFVEEGIISDKMRKWLLGEFIDFNLAVVGSFQLYLQTKEQQDFIQTMKLIFETQNSQMQFYKTYLKRLEEMFKAIAIQDEISAEVFQLYPDKIKAICQVYYLTGDTMEMLDTLHTLHNVQSNLRKINVATLNFSGINNSPFQYDDGTDQMNQLNQNFKQILKQQLGNITQFQLGKIDKKFQEGRLSICYGSDIELVDNKLPNKQQFRKLWMEKYQQNYLRKNPQYIPSGENINNTINYDYICYLTVAKYVYKQQYINQNSLKEVDACLLLHYLNDKKVEPLQIMEKKKMKIMEYIFKNSIDAMFIQEGNDIDWISTLPRNFAVIKNSDSVIIYNKQKMGNPKNSYINIYKNQLNFNNDSVCLFTDRGYLLISVHLKANNLNIQQAKQMFQTIHTILEQHPMLRVIIGIDANHFLNPDRSDFNIIPDIPDIPTTKKKRSYIQAQLKKSGVQVCQVKDHLISNRVITQYRIEDVEGNDPERYIPNSSHPYDHYIVKAKFY